MDIDLHLHLVFGGHVYTGDIAEGGLVAWVDGLDGEDVLEQFALFAFHFWIIEYFINYWMDFWVGRVRVGLGIFYGKSFRVCIGSDCSVLELNWVKTVFFQVGY